jgi:hypothetical protein
MCLGMEPVRYNTRTSEEQGRDMIVLGMHAAWHHDQYRGVPRLRVSKTRSYSPFPEKSRHARVLHVSLCIK